MDMKAYFTRLTTYHLWAQECALQSLEAIDIPPDEALTLFDHILKADLIWHDRIAGESPSPNLFELVKSTEQSRAALERCGVMWREFLGRLDERDLATPITYRNIKGDNFTNSLEDILTHVLNHGTYHRAQIAKLVRAAGGTPARTDFIVFAREQEGK
ncbi:DinB family protein [bacterium]|nr:DinB family protein [bacterium]